MWVRISVVEIAQGASVVETDLVLRVVGTCLDTTAGEPVVVYAAMACSGHVAYYAIALRAIADGHPVVQSAPDPHEAVELCAKAEIWRRR